MPKDEELVKAALKKRLEDKSSAPVKLSEFLDSRDLTSQGTESSFKLSDLKDFLGLAHKDDLSKVAANIQDLNKMNANKLTQLLRASAELFYTQQDDIGSSVNVYRSAIHALLLKTIEKTLEESKKSGLSLADTIKKINTITEMVEPEPGQHQDINLLNDFSAYQDPFNLLLAGRLVVRRQGRQHNCRS